MTLHIILCLVSFLFDIPLCIADTRHIFFSVAASTTNDYSVGDTIRYDHIFSNIGGGWSDTSHHFRCPVTGYYMFTVSMYKHWDSSYNYDCEATLDISGNRMFLVRVFDVNHTGVRYASSGQAILPCTEGHQVYMKMVGSCRLFDNSFRRNLFSGFLLTPGL